MTKNNKIIYLIIVIAIFAFTFLIWRTGVFNNYLPFFLTTDGWNKNEREINKLNNNLEPSREPYPDCKWKKVIGAGLEIWGQSCDYGDKKLEVNASETLPGMFLEDVTKGSPVAIEQLIQIFNLENKSIDSVIPLLSDSKDWKVTDKCIFTKVSINRSDVARYTLMPTGAALKKFESDGKNEPITSTCAGYGMGNSGVQYFEIYNSNPNKVLFINAGQELPMFDENTIVVK